MKQIRERILSAEDGTIFAAYDFADVADSATVRQSMNRLIQSEILRRVLRGIFEKPKYCSVLNEFIEVNPDAVAKTLARMYHWTSTPYGNAVLYLSGLSSQRPILVMGHIEHINGIQLELSLNTGQIRNSSDNILTKKNIVLD